MLTNTQNIFAQAEKWGFGELHFKMDQHNHLFAIIALHNIRRGPALGGCRWRHYATTEEAMIDVMRLARGMTYKSAIARVPHGGGKAVLIKPAQEVNTEKYFAAFADFVNELQGRYITAIDSGTTPVEMDIIAKYSKHVTATTYFGNPSPVTARGVFRGIEAAVNAKLGKTSLQGLHIAIQGVGQVGHTLAEMCYQHGARLTVADTNPLFTARCVSEFGATVVDPEIIHKTACDVFAPSALGGILNAQTIPELNCPVVAGSANNQLATSEDGDTLHARGILYAPDYAINAGGLIYASGRYYGVSDQQIERKVDEIYDTLSIIFARATKLQQATSHVADALAEEILASQEVNAWIAN